MGPAPSTRMTRAVAPSGTTVVSTAVPGQAILDAGSKTFSHDPLSSGPRTGFGYLVEEPAIPLDRLNEEHGFLDLANARSLHVGEVFTVQRGHAQ